MSRQPSHFLGTPATAPGPSGPDMLRSMPAIRRDPLSFLHRMWLRFGDVYQFPIPRPPSYVVNSPDGVRHVLVDAARNYDKTTIQYRALALVTGDGLLTSDGARWKADRRSLQPAFHHAALQRVGKHVQHSAARVMQQWRALGPGAVVDVDEFMMEAALEVVAQSLMDADLTGRSADIAQATLDALGVVIARARVPITPPGWLPTPANRVLRRSVGVLDDAVGEMVAAYRSQDSADLLGLLLTLRSDGDEAMTVEHIRDQLVTFIVAGHETVASALGWAWGLLAQHPQVADRVAAEANAVAPDRPITFDDYPALVFTKRVIDETLRLYPPAWLITRRALSDDHVSGIDIPRGALVIMSPWLLHRHPDLWSEPDCFMPERFEQPVPRFAHVPFGAGPRLCIGRDFSYVESVMLIAELNRAFTCALPAERPLPMGEPLVTIRPRGGMPIVIRPR